LHCLLGAIDKIARLANEKADRSASEKAQIALAGRTLPALLETFLNSLTLAARTELGFLPLLLDLN
jgi:hypothetical protein